MIQPDAQMIRLALFQAAHSPCRSKRGVAIYADVPGTGPVLLGAGHNGPPRGGECPGRAVCAGTCGQRSVHAEVRAIRLVQWPQPRASELVHVELGADGDVVPCDGPACWQCSREILDAGFIDGVWLYQSPASTRELLFSSIESGDVRYDSRAVYVGEPPKRRVEHVPQWVRYTATAFHRETLLSCGIPT